MLAGYLGSNHTNAERINSLETALAKKADTATVSAIDQRVKANTETIDEMHPRER
jgi:hypothetical protein